MADLNTEMRQSDFGRNSRFSSQMESVHSKQNCKVNFKMTNTMTPMTRNSAIEKFPPFLTQQTMSMQRAQVSRIQTQT